jgi:uncharacterized repeat protein (TIGR03803 family)
MTMTEPTLGMRLRAVGIALALAIVLVPAVIGTRSAEAQTYSVLYYFTGSPDGDAPFAGLTPDAAGNFYGTTYSGGNNGCEGGCGIIFKLDETGNETVLYTFWGRHGKSPAAGLVRDAAGNLYGTTQNGGSTGCADHIGCGVVFKLDETGKETVLYTFTGGSDGAYPEAGLILDAAGNFYGTTMGGGREGCTFGCGTVFKLDKTGKETVLYSFKGGSDGEYPEAGLILDAAGNFYGTTTGGGREREGCTYYGCGTVFKLDKTGKETVLHRFGSKKDGANPQAGLVRDAAGNLYGTTFWGGSGTGTVFKVAKSGEETVLYSFKGGEGDGANPEAGLILDASGNLYGTTYGGGSSNCSPYACGAVFMLDSAGKESVLHFFDGSDGQWPQASLLRDAAGNLYGTTLEGGASGSGCVYGCGVVFEITP